MDISENTTHSTHYLDYRPARCRCNAVVYPHNVKCLNCGRKQNLLFDNIDKIPSVDLRGLASELEKKIAEHPWDYVSLNKLAGVRILLGNFDEAEKHLRVLLEKKPDLPDARLNFGVLLAVMGKTEEAIVELEYFVRTQPHSPKAERALKAVCSLKNIPYEEAQIQLKPSALPKTSGKNKKTPIPAGVRDVFTDNEIPKIRTRRTSPFDLFLVIFVLLIALMLAFVPMSRVVAVDFLNSLASPLNFRVEKSDTNDKSDETARLSVASPEENEIEKPPVVINQNPDTTSYFPLAPGNKWEFFTFDTRDNQGLGARENNGSRVITVVGLASTSPDIWKIDNGGTTVYYLERNGGLFTTDSLSSPWSRLICQIPSPTQPGVSTNSQGQSVIIESEEDVSTALGLIRCIKVHTIINQHDKIEWWAWYGQGVGLVKFVSGGRDGTYHVLELRNYELK